MRQLISFEKVKSSVEVIAHLTVIVSLVLGWKTYVSQVQQSRRDASFGVISRLSEGDLVGVQRRLSMELGRSELSKFKGISVPRSTIAHFVESLAATSQDRVVFDQDVFALVSYFDDVQVCVATGTCDPEVMEAHIGEVAGRYACLLLPYVHSVREDYLLNDLGDGMAQLARYTERC